jgi:hypothetical protein
MVQKEATRPRVVQPTVIHVTVPNSHRILQPTSCRVVTSSTSHPMVRRSADPQNLSSDMLAEMVQQTNHVFRLPTGPRIKTSKRADKNTPVIIMPEMANAIICPDELITLLRYRIRWMRSTAN